MGEGMLGRRVLYTRVRTDAVNGINNSSIPHEAVVDQSVGARLAKRLCYCSWQTSIALLDRCILLNI